MEFSFSRKDLEDFKDCCYISVRDATTGEMTDLEDALGFGSGAEKESCLKTIRAG